MFWKKIVSQKLLLTTAGTTVTTLGTLAAGTCGTFLVAFGLLDECAV